MPTPVPWQILWSPKNHPFFLSILTLLIRGNIHAWLQMVCIWFVILVYLLFTENKNGLNFPDDESVAVSVQTLCGWPPIIFLCFLHRVPPNYVLLCVCYVFPCSPQTPCVRSKISAPKTEMDVRNRDPPTGVLIPQQSLPCRLGPCSTAKVNRRTI